MARSRKYLDFLRRMPCASCGARPPSEAAHGPVTGVGLKGSDFDAIPLCAECHREGRLSMHAMGWSEFAFEWDLDVELIRRDLRERFERWR